MATGRPSRTRSFDGQCPLVTSPCSSATKATSDSLETTSDHQIWPVFNLHHVTFQESLCHTLVVSRLRWAPSLDVAQ